MRAAVSRECKAVRTQAGIFDASTLGKIEVVGRDAARFLDRIYPNAIASLEPGRCRYGLMLREDGYIFDDGVVARLAPDRFHVTTTTGGAGRVLQHMEDYLQTEWPQLRVHLTSTTEQYAVIALQGPRSRNLLASLVEGIDRDVVRLVATGVASAAGAPTGGPGFDPEAIARQAVDSVATEAGREFWAAVDRLAALRIVDRERSLLVVELVEAALRHVHGSSTSREGRPAADAGLRSWRDRLGADDV